MANIPMQINDETVCVLLEDVGKAGIKALIYLFRKGETNVYQMTLKGSMGTGNTRSVLLQLHKLGLVEDKEGKGNETIYSLLDKGKRVAAHLDAAERILSEGT
jgi:hypothetical protein